MCVDAAFFAFKEQALAVELAQENYLRPNGHGGYLIRQSDLSSWARCQLQKYYQDRANADPEAAQPKTLSATEYGTVVHYALMNLEQLHHQGRDDALDVAIATFEHYWHPDNIHHIATPVQEWLPRQTYGGLRDRGRRVITDYHGLLRRDDSRLLALEYQFAVPLEIAGVTHTLTGTVDRLSIKKHYTKPYLSIDDYKTGKQPTYLRHNVQGHAYAYATTQPEFWTGWENSGVGELATFDLDTWSALRRFFDSYGYSVVDSRYTHPDDERLMLAARRFRWVNMQEVKFADGGWRTERDYARLVLAIDAYVRACEAGIYSPTNTGEVCIYCPFRSTCGGIGLPPEKAGAP